MIFFTLGSCNIVTDIQCCFVQCIFLVCSGKTSLLNSLSGKATYGTVSGVVMMNGKEDKLEKYKCVMGFVPQDDIMHTDLTVEENLLFSAKYRLPAHTSHSSIMSAVERAIQVIRNKLSDTHVSGSFLQLASQFDNRIW